MKVLATFCGSLRETNPQKVALERSLQLFGEAFLEKWGEGAKAVSAWSGRGKLLDQRLLGIGTSSVSIPFDGKWLKSSRRRILGSSPARWQIELLAY
jgi:hypothetical protein